MRENTPDGEVFRIDGERPTRWVRQTDFCNDEAVGYLADRLGRLGVEEALFKAGAVAGATVLIGPADNAVVFDWEPTLIAGAELLGQRGTDLRLEEATRPTREEKRADYADRRAARTAARAELAAERKAGHWATAGEDVEDSEDSRAHRDERGRPPARRGSRPPARRQGRLVVAHRASGGPLDEARLVGARRRPRRAPAGRAPGRARLLGGHRGRHRSARPGRRPRDLATQQAAASVGQGALVAAYQRRSGPTGSRSDRCCSPPTT